MLRAAMERCAVAAFAFMAAATWLGVGLIHGLLCLFVSLLGAQAMRVYQRRNGSRARNATRRRRPARPRPAAGRPARPGLFDADHEGFEWAAAGDATW